VRKILIILAVLTFNPIAGPPAAAAEPIPEIDWKSLVEDGAADPDAEVGEEMCARPDGARPG
jgi:hypothetical protein